MELNKEEIVYKKVNELKLNPKNPRKNDDAVGVVAKSIEKYGFKNPLIIDADNVVWCGNTRLKASIKLGLKEVPCIVANDLTEQQIRELALIDNKSSEIAEWDIQLLEEELFELDLSDFALDWELSNDDVEIEREDISDKIKDEYQIIVDCKNEEELECLYNELQERGYICKISTL
jgi:ParB-like chromosome segregation protein Spo0J